MTKCSIPSLTCNIFLGNYHQHRCYTSFCGKTEEKERTSCKKCTKQGEERTIHQYHCIIHSSFVHFNKAGMRGYTTQEDDNMKNT